MPDLQRYFTARNSRRFLLSLLLSVAGGSGYCYWTLSGEQQHLMTEKGRNAQLQETLAALSQQWSAMSSAQAVAPAPMLPRFSVADTIRSADGRLTRWRPDKPVAQLELSLLWEKVPCIFRHLAKYKGTSLEAFHMRADPSSARVSLTLEFRYAAH